MDDSKKKGAGKSSPDESWVDKLDARGASPQGVTSYVGLLRQSPSDDDTYELYLGLDMRSHLRIQKADVVHWENLSPEKSPFGSLGGCRVLVRKGARITSVRTATSTFESGAADDFDLDIRLGARASVGTGGGNQTIPDTGCGAECETIPPFSDPDAGCNTVPATFCGCTGQCTIDTCPCIPTQAGKTCGANCQFTKSFTCTCPTQFFGTCQTNCGTCNTNCGTCATQCGTCATHCGTCRVNTCNTKCGQETCVACTHIFTQCNQHGCGPA